MLRSGVSVTDVQRSLRHRDINTTRRYTHEALEDVARAVAGKLPGAAPSAAAAPVGSNGPGDN
ncbi:hypothetical protein [Cupriavidus sp. UYPR2.512]|uniref:hypothetical protein n=1 Tax=Cupriavidus sp. UYPR2.512 TaxID=1080187 RepID=UPI00350FAF5C